MRIAAGRPDAIAAGQVLAVPLPRDARNIPREALVLRDQRGQLRAYLNRCRHLPIPIDGGSRRYLTPDGQHLLCGTHGARYRLDDGYCVAGPCAGEALQAIELELDGDTLYLVLRESD